MTPWSPEDRNLGPSERDIERAEQKAFDPTSNGQSSVLWKLAALLIALVSIAALLMNIILPLFDGQTGAQSSPGREPARVVGVVDGTTLIVETQDGRETVRYIGVEPHLPGSAFAGYAAEVSRSLVGGKEVLLESDKVDRDGEALLRYVIVDETAVNLLIVASGVARADLDGPNDRYRELFRQLEESARAQELGIWSNPDVSTQPF